MTNFGAMNDSYYQPADCRAWDYFVDYCEENGLDPEVEDFDQWEEDQREAAEEAAADRARDYAREREYDQDFDRY